QQGALMNLFRNYRAASVAVLPMLALAAVAAGGEGPRSCQGPPLPALSRTQPKLGSPAADAPADILEKTPTVKSLTGMEVKLVGTWRSVPSGSGIAPKWAGSVTLRFGPGRTFARTTQGFCMPPATEEGEFFYDGTTLITRRHGTCEWQKEP